ncbi:alpha/beta hydrolase family esterase [Zavarzinella formosa]|uniref:alpha/beta hydrolase family esterase n=1 Tax=Zavarzinella formosa TaxID=360055 RepID=UPI0002EDED49|nr:prolyl oligopeptidase family serine peptidase [Zavarzinella formosa]
MRFLIITLITSLFAISSLRAANPLAEKEWMVEGVVRKALLYVPTTGKADAPVIFAFHGHGGTMGHAARTFAYQTQWPEAVVVYMQGLNTPGKLTDPEGKKSGWQANAGDLKDRDLKFFDAVLATLKKDHKIDEKRIYCTGHSNGGAFTYLLWAQRGDVFAAVAPSAAIFVQGMKDLKPKPALHVAGESDPLVKYDWQKRMMDVVKKLDGCDTEGKEWAKLGDLVGTKYESKTGTPFITLISPGTHTFPEKAPELIVKFFKEQVKK